MLSFFAAGEGALSVWLTQSEALLCLLPTETVCLYLVLPHLDSECLFRLSGILIVSVLL